jgi:hypothetical protein
LFEFERLEVTAGEIYLPLFLERNIEPHEPVVLRCAAER